MLQAIRDGSKGWITWLIVGFVALTFIMIGTGNYLGSQDANEILTKVGGVTITKAWVDKRAKRILNQMPADEAKALDLKSLKERALKDIVNETLLIQAALKKGFVISDQQVIHLLSTLPDFQENGAFSPDKYRRILYQLEFTDAEFRKEIKNALLIEQLRQAFRQTAFSSPETIHYALQLENQKRDFDFVLMPNSLFNKDIKISDTDLKGYYNKHSNDFMTKQKVKIEYLELERAHQSEETFTKKADDLIQLSYDQNDSLNYAADKLGLVIKNLPDWIEEGQETYPGFLNHPKVKATLFSEEILGKMNSEVIQIDESRYIVFRVSEYQKPAQKDFSVVKAEIETKLLAELTAKKAQAVANEWALAIKNGKNAKDLTKDTPLKWESVEGATRSIGHLPLVLVEGVFALPRPAASKIIAKALPLTESYQAVVVLKKVTDAPIDQDAEYKKRLETELNYYGAQLEFDLFAKAVIH